MDENGGGLVDSEALGEGYVESVASPLRIIVARLQREAAGFPFVPAEPPPAKSHSRVRSPGWAWHCGTS